MLSRVKTAACLLVTLMITISLSGCLGGNEAELEAEIADKDQIIANNNLVITDFRSRSRKSVESVDSGEL